MEAAGPREAHKRCARLVKRDNAVLGVREELPMEFAVEARKLLGVSLEGSVG